MRVSSTSQRLIIAPMIVAAMVALACSQSDSPRRYGLELTVTPAAADASAFETKVVVRDLASGDVVLQPRILSRAGEPATIEAKDRASGLDYTISVEVGEGGGAATYSAEIRDAAGVVARQDGRLRFLSS